MSGRQLGGCSRSSLLWVKRHVLDHHPVGACEYGADLVDAVDEGVDRACQVTDVSAGHGDHDRGRRDAWVRCACGRARGLSRRVVHV